MGLQHHSQKKFSLLLIIYYICPKGCTFFSEQNRNVFKIKLRDVESPNKSYLERGGQLLVGDSCTKANQYFNSTDYIHRRKRKPLKDSHVSLIVLQLL